MSDLPANVRIKVIPNKPTHIIRNIPANGTILVHQNEELKSSDIVGKYNQSGGFRMINVSQEIHISPKEITKYLTRTQGKNIYKGELLAEKKSMFGNKEIKSPTDAIIESVDNTTGIVMLKLLPKELPVISGVTGIVDFIDAQNGNIYIKSSVTHVYGILGSGKMRGGFLKIHGDQKNITMEAQISSDVHQMIIVTGALVYVEALKKALSLGASGIISGGINARDFRSLIGLNNFKKGYGNDIGISLWIEHGYGGLQISDRVFALLKQYEGKYIYIDGNNRRILLPNSDPNMIPKLRTVMLPIMQQTEVELPEFQLGNVVVGSRIRLIWPPYMGSEGVVIAVDQNPTVMPTGISTYLVTVEVANQKIKVPYTNLELII
jgi:hypothetical protein